MFRYWALALFVITANAHGGEAQAPPVERKILSKHDQSGVPGKEIVIGTATFAPGAVMGFHDHPGDEAGYVIRGTVTLKTRGAPDKTLKAGDSLFNLRGDAHSVVAGVEGATIVAVWVVDKGVPMSSAVP
jgi:quercetin dioxygenase-like cupin family protein